jgi:CRISPR/Cas system endoribonuclease Cas6 (RAMP superfamily)
LQAERRITSEKVFNTGSPIIFTFSKEENNQFANLREISNIQAAFMTIQRIPQAR